MIRILELDPWHLLHRHAPSFDIGVGGGPGRDSSLLTLFGFMLHLVQTYANAHNFML